MRRKRDYTPLSWQDYFDSTKDVYVNGKDVSFISDVRVLRQKALTGKLGKTVIRT